MRKFILLLGLVCSASSFMTLASTSETNPNEGANLSTLTKQYPINWISVQQIANELRDKKPINVGFDIDDTLLYSSPAFVFGKNKFSPDNNAYLKNPEFWNEVSSSGWDRFSVPKKSARELIKMHLAHNDNIFFITGRPEPVNGKEDLTQILKDDFGLPASKVNKVIYAGFTNGAKISHMKKNQISIFYGDSDNDILDAKSAGAEGIRVIRPLNSTNEPMPENGSLGERVIVNSWY